MHDETSKRGREREKDEAKNWWKFYAVAGCWSV